MDISKLPSDRLYKVKAFGGLLLLITFGGATLGSWHWNNLEWYAIEARAGNLEVDRKRLAEMLDEWKTALKVKDKIKSDIAYKKNFGPTEPLTDEEKTKIRDNLNQLAQDRRIAVADPENVIRMQDMMRDMFREMPPVEEMENTLAEVQKSIDVYMAQASDIYELDAKVATVEKEIANSRAKLGYQERLTWLGFVGFGMAAFFSFLLMRSGFSEWDTAEKAEREEKKAERAERIEKKWSA